MSVYKNAVVECGDFNWRGSARTLDEAIIGAFAVSAKLPKNPSLLVRAKVAGHRKSGGGWHYIDFAAALRIAGYKVRKIKEGFKLA